MKVVVLSLALLGALPVRALDVAGVLVPDTVTVEGAELKLNGAGLRRATMFNLKVYVGALYLTTPSADPDAIVRADEAKSIQMRFLRGVDRDKVMGAFREGFERNSASDAKSLQMGLDRVATVIPVEVKERMMLTVTYLPGRGTTVVGPGGEAITIEGKAFADAMFRNWLGRQPADDGLKSAMLGVAR
jgi:hypothetical protein